MNDKSLYNKFKRHTDHVNVGYFNVLNFRIRYVEVGEPEKQAVIFIHGAPGSLSAFSGFLKDGTLLRHFRMISVDRPGYGHSNHRKPAPSIQRQAEILLPLVENESPAGRPILVGHSYGCPIAAVMASESPEKVRGLILAGAAMDPDRERIFWISHLIALPWIESLLPASIYAANVEKLEHAGELRKMRQKWGNIRMPVTIIHGQQDWLVPVGNAFYTREVLVNADIKLIIKKNAGHLIPWLYPELIRDELIRMIDP